MDDASLIAGNAPLLLAALSQKIVASGGMVFQTVEEEIKDKKKQKKPLLSVVSEKHRNIAWDPVSPVSTRNLLLSMMTPTGIPWQSFFICRPSLNIKSFTELSSLDLALSLDQNLKGFLLLGREILREYQKKQAGRVVFVLHFPSLSQSGPAPSAAMVCGAFRSFASSFFRPEDPHIEFYGFESDCESDEEFASFIYEGLENQTKKMKNKWNYFGKSSFFASKNPIQKIIE